jgi:hypothetical protein
MPLFLFIFIFYNIHTVQSSNHIHPTHSPRPLSISSSLVAQWERPPCGAEPGIELRPAFQHADALPSEPRRTKKLINICCYWGSGVQESATSNQNHRAFRSGFRLSCPEREKQID